MKNIDVNNLIIENNEREHRWEVQIGRHIAVANYQIEGDTIYFTSTEVPPELEGQGIASKLIKTALEDARTKRMKVVPYCSFTAGYIKRHPEYQELVHPDFIDLVS